jgi:tetratricopeptide (TPR) repeat protein
MVEKSRPDPRPLYRTNGQMLVAKVLARAGLKDSAKAVIESARAQAPANDPRIPTTRYNEAAAWLELGEPDKALEALEIFLEYLPQRKTYIANEAWFRTLRYDPRFVALVGSEGTQ